MTNVLFNLAGVAGTGNEAVVDSDTITITVSGTPTVNTDFRFDEIRISVAPGV